MHAYAPGQDPFAARPQPNVSAAALGKPQPIKWILPIAAIGFVVVLIAGTIGWVAGLPDATTLSIESMPPGATVRIGGDGETQTTPTVLEELQPGQTVNLEISHPGYETSSVEIILDEGANSRMVLLNPVRATVRITSDPPGAQVWVNDVLRGAAPLNVGGLSIGETIRIRATAPRRGELTQSFTVSERTAALTLTLPSE